MFTVAKGLVIARVNRTFVTEREEFAVDGANMTLLSNHVELIRTVESENSLNFLAGDLVLEDVVMGQLSHYTY